MRSATLGGLTGFVAGAAFALVSLVQHAGRLALVHPTSGSLVLTWLHSLGIYAVLGAVAGCGLGLLVGLGGRLVRREPRTSTLLGTLAAVATTTVVYIHYGAYRYLTTSVYIAKTDPLRVRAQLVALAVSVAVGIAVGALAWWWTLRRESTGGRPRALGGVLVGLVLLGLVASVGLSSLRGPGAPEREPSPDASRTRVFLFGIDAASWQVMMPVLRAGRMPNLESIMERGTWGDLLPYYSLVHHSDWTTMITGVSPRRHDVWLSFMKEEGRYFFVPSGPQHRQAPAVWTLLGASGRPAAVVNWLVTAPPEEMESGGVMVAEMKLPGEPRTYPPELEEELDPLVEVVQERSGPPRVELFPRVIDDVVEHSFVNLDSMEAQFRYVLDMKRWDLFVGGIFTTDHAQHLFFKFLYPEEFTEDKWRVTDAMVADYGDVIPDVFARVDEILGTVMSYADEDTVIVVMSDHGMEPTRDLFVNLKLNAVLDKLDVLRFYDPVERPEKLDRLNDFLAVTGREPLSAELGTDGIVYRVPNQFLFVWTDFDETLAYSSGTRTYEDIHGVSINLEGREPDGIVSPADFEALRDRLIEELRSIVVLETGTPLFNGVYRREEEPDPTMRESGYDITVHLGSPVRRLDPDRHVEIAGRRYRLDDLLEDEENSADHSLYAMFAMAGGPVRDGVLLRRSVQTPLSFAIEKYGGRIPALEPVKRAARGLGLIPSVNGADVAPTVLHLLGEPVPPDLDGRVLHELIEPGFVPTRP